MNKERVNIQYSIDLNELSGEVVRLIARATNVAEAAMQAEFSDLKQIDENHALSLHAISTVDIARKRLAAIDYALNDVAQIINGYLTFKVQENLQEQADQRPFTPDPPPQQHDPVPAVDPLYAAMRAADAGS
jgi:hypothetical protein